MQSFFYHVLSSPETYKAVLAEIDNAVRDGVIPAQGNITWAQSQNLAYFQAAMKEAMRVRPAVGLNITRLVPPEGTELDGQFFPGGTSIAINGWVLHRDKQVFGEDADAYRAERWLADAEKARVMERYMFQVRSQLLRLMECHLLCMLTRNNAVRRRLPPVHWPEPGPPRDQQGGPAHSARLPLRAGRVRSAFEGPRLVLCSTRGSGCVSAKTKLGIQYFRNRG